MNWFQKTAHSPIVLWHATLADLAEQIVERGAILPSLTLEEETGQNFAGWNFSDSERVYGEGVYLARTADLALYYASLRLKKRWYEVEDFDDLYRDEDYWYLGLFKVFVMNQSKLRAPVNYQLEQASEFEFLGPIINQPNPEAWYEGPTWVSQLRYLDEYINQRANIFQNQPDSIDNSN